MLSDMVLVSERYIQDIADAIREKSKSDKKEVIYKPSTMGDGIRQNIVTDIDSSHDTVQAEYLVEGYTSHDREGNPITGTMRVVNDVAY